MVGCWWVEEAAQRPNEVHPEEMPDRSLLTGETCFLPRPLALPLLTGSGLYGGTAHTKPCRKT